MKKVLSIISALLFFGAGCVASLPFDTDEDAKQARLANCGQHEAAILDDFARQVERTGRDISFEFIEVFWSPAEESCVYTADMKCNDCKKPGGGYVLYEAPSLDRLFTLNYGEADKEEVRARFDEKVGEYR